MLYINLSEYWTTLKADSFLQSQNRIEQNRIERLYFNMIILKAKSLWVVYKKKDLINYYKLLLLLSCYLTPTTMSSRLFTCLLQDYPSKSVYSGMIMSYNTNIADLILLLIYQCNHLGMEPWSIGVIIKKQTLIIKLNTPPPQKNTPQHEQKVIPIHAV